MKAIYATRLLLLVTSLWLSSASAEGAGVEGPKVLLSGVTAEYTLSNLGHSPVTVFVNGKAVGQSQDGEFTLSHTTASQALLIEAQQAGEVLLTHEVVVIPGWVSLLPPVIAIVLAFLLRAVVPALFVGLLTGAWAANGLTASGAVKGIFDTMTIYILDAMIDPGHAAIILFSLLIGGMVGIISKNGGMLGIVNAVIPIARTPKRGQAVIAALGLSIFFDDYANTMIVGNATRPVSDRLKISREKLAYLVDSTAAPVTTVAIITTWIGFQVGLIDDAISDIDALTAPAYSFFLHSIGYSFYPFLAICLVFLVVFTGRDFGPMLRAEQRARTSGEVLKPRENTTTTGNMQEFEEKSGVPCRAINGVLPILALVAGVIGGMLISGEGDSLQDIVGSADAYVVLIWASLLSCIVAIGLTLGQRLLNLEEVVEAWTAGAKFMISGMILLVMAWAIADVTQDLQTAPYLISILGETISPYLLPALVFLLAACSAFASGSSWGVMAILMPLVIPLCWAVLEVNGIADQEHMYILYACIACVLTGAVWADHCSPISDTTVLTCLATGCDLMDHVTTQIPYALLGGLTALCVCVLPVSYGAPWWLMLIIGVLVVAVGHQWLSKPVEPT